MDMRRGALDQDHHIHLVTDPVVDHLRINTGKHKQAVLLSQRIDKNTDILKFPVVAEHHSRYRSHRSGQPSARDPTAAHPEGINKPEFRNSRGEYKFVYTGR